MIVVAADYAGPGAPLPGHRADSAVVELRRSLEALSGDEVALSRAMRRPLMVDRPGCLPLGNLLLRSLTSGFGDLGHASLWLGARLGIRGSVLPATVEPLKFTIEPGSPCPAQHAPDSEHALDRVRLIPERPEVTPGLVGAIRRAGLVLLAPGSLFTGILVASAIPDIRDALCVANGPVIWICNLESEHGETANEQFAALRWREVRTDAILYDPGSSLGIEVRQLSEEGVATIPRPLIGLGRTVHDPELLRAALTEAYSELMHRP